MSGRPRRSATSRAPRGRSGGDPRRLAEAHGEADGRRLREDRRAGRGHPPRRLVREPVLADEGLRVRRARSRMASAGSWRSAHLQRMPGLPPLRARPARHRAVAPPIGIPIAAMAALGGGTSQAPPAAVPAQVRVSAATAGASARPRIDGRRGLGAGGGSPQPGEASARRRSPPRRRRWSSPPRESAASPRPAEVTTG